MKRYFLKKKIRQNNSALACRENENNFPQIKGKKLLLAQVLIPSVTPYSEGNTGSATAKSAIPISLEETQVRNHFSLLRPTLLPWLSCAFGDILAILLFQGPGCRQRHSKTQKSLTEKSSTGDFYRHHSHRLFVTFARACVLWRDYCNTCNTSHNLVFCTPETFSRSREKELSLTSYA